MTLLFVLTRSDVAALATQSSSATLVGDVVDTSGAFVSGAELLLVNVETSSERRSKSDASGRFTFTTLPPGRYSLRAMLSGFTSAELRDLTLNVDDRVAVRLELSIGTRTEGVTVVAEAQRINRSPAVGTVVDRQFVENLPLNGRSLQSLLTLAPGVAQTTSGFSVNGQRTQANYFTVDGVSVNVGGNTFSASSGQLPAFTALGTTASMVSVDALQEFRVQTSSYAPEFGRMPGGQISMVTRSGTNSYRGSAFEYFRDDALDATNWFVNNGGLDKSVLRQHSFGGVLGGPVLRGRTFFFGSYEGLRLKQPRAFVLSVPTLEARQAAAPVVQAYLNAFPMPNGRELGGGVAQFLYAASDPAQIDATSVRGDHNAGTSWKFFGRINHTPSNRDTRLLSAVTKTIQNLDGLTIGATWVISSRAVHDVRLAYTTGNSGGIRRLDDFGGAVPWTQAHAFGPGRTPDNTLFSFLLLGCCTITEGSVVAMEQRQLNVVDSLAWSTQAHEFKAGVDFRRSNPAYDAGGDLAVTLGVTPASAQLGRASTFSTTLRDLAGVSAIFDNLSLYAQDHWRVTSRLTLTYGIRWEFIPPMRMSRGPLPVTLENIEAPYSGRVRFAPPDTPLWETRYDNFAPRVGASVVLVDRPGAQLILRGGGGVFHDIGFGFSGNAFQSYPFVMTIPSTTPLLPLSPESMAPAFGTAIPTVVTIMDRQLKLPRTYQWNVSTEQSLGAHQTLTVGYVGASGRGLLKADRYTINIADTPTVRSTVQVMRNRGYSDYHALQVQLQRRLHQGVQAIASYTLGHSQDTASSESATNVPADRLPPALDYGDSLFDVRHVFNAAITYQTPKLTGMSLWGTLGSDWGIDVMFRARSSQPLDIRATTPFPPETVSVRADVVPGQPIWIDDPTTPAGRRVNPAAFAVPPPETQGNLVRGTVRGFNVSQIDAALRREFRATSRVRLQLRFEMFNLLNTPHFADPSVEINSQDFGRAVATLNNAGGLNAVYEIGGPRSSQLALKILF